METALVVPVPEAAALVDPWLGKGLSAHVTLTVPFVPSEQLDEEELARFAAGLEPFDYELARCARFPTGLYLVPEPEELLLALIDAVLRRWPEYPRYGGEHPDVVPHVTVAERDFDAAEAAVAPHLPIAARAEELLVLTLVDPEVRRWEPHARFRLGGGR
jgi:2'-5' RNA ligase